MSSSYASSGSSESTCPRSTTSSFSRSSQSDSLSSMSNSSEKLDPSKVDSRSSYWTLENRIPLAGLKLDAMKFPLRSRTIDCIPPWRGNPTVVPGRIPPPEEQRSSGLRKFLKVNGAWDTSSVSSCGSSDAAVINPFEYRVTEAPVFHEFMRTAYCPRPYTRYQEPLSVLPKIRVPLESRSSSEVDSVASDATPRRSTLNI